MVSYNINKQHTNRSRCILMFPRGNHDKTSLAVYLKNTDKVKVCMEVAVSFGSHLDRTTQCATQRSLSP